MTGFSGIGATVVTLVNCIAETKGVARRRINRRRLQVTCMMYLCMFVLMSSSMVVLGVVVRLTQKEEKVRRGHFVQSRKCNISGPNVHSIPLFEEYEPFFLNSI